MYGLKKGPKAWYARLDRYLLQQGFNKGTKNRNIYFKVEKDKILILQVYVHNIVFGGNEAVCKRFIEKM